MSTELTFQQMEALDRFKKLKVGALFMKMGTGKTRAALELVNYNEVELLLYLTPYSTIENITAEIELWGVNCEYKVVGYETIASSDKTYLELLSELDKYEKKFIIADESIFIKNGLTKRFKRSCTLREKCQYALILNGTPIVKNEKDIFNQMEFLSEKIFNMSYYQFIETFFTKIYKRKWNQEIITNEFYEPNREVFTKIIEPYVYVADLEFNKNEYDDYIWVHFDEWKYECAKMEVLDKYSDYELDSIILLFNLLHKIASTSEDKNKRVAKYISNKKVICYCQFLEEVEQIKSMCDCFVITGSTSKKERKSIVEEFKKSENKPLVLTFGVGSYSLNLQFCDEIVYSSLTFNFGNLEQSKYRIKRLGQKNDIQYTYILSDAGINDMILKNIDKKTSLSEYIKSQIEEGTIKDVIKNI